VVGNERLCWRVEREACPGVSKAFDSRTLEERSVSESTKTVEEPMEGFICLVCERERDTTDKSNRATTKRYVLNSFCVY